MTINLSLLIWSAVRAILKFVLTAACGFYLAKRKFLDSSGTRTISQTILNVFLPCLLFAKIVEGLDSSKLPQIGVLILTSSLYMLLGLLFGVIVLYTTKIPQGWRWGVLAAGAYSNWGDLPLVLIATIVQSAPFKAEDEAKGLAYVAVYIFVQTTVIFALNGICLIAKDFDHEPSPEDPQGIVDRYRTVSRKLHEKKNSASIASLGMVREEGDLEGIITRKTTRSMSKTAVVKPSESLGTGRRESTDSLRLRPVVSGLIEPGEIHATIDTPSPAPIPPISPEVMSLKAKAITFLWKLVSPPSLATILGFIFAITPIRKIFVSPSPWSAPDGSPPLSFIIDIMNFIGAASVPSSLLILGYSLSRLKVARMPALSGAILMAILKMVVAPILAILWTQCLTFKTSLVPRDDLVLRLVMILPAATPTATSLLYITQILAPEGREEGVMCLSVFLVIQYLVIGLTLTITTVYTLNLIT